MSVAIGRDSDLRLTLFTRFESESGHLVSLAGEGQ